MFDNVGNKMHGEDSFNTLLIMGLKTSLQHWTRLANIQINTQTRSSLHLKAKLSLKTCRELLIKLCASGPDFLAWIEWLAMIATV